VGKEFTNCYQDVMRAEVYAALGFRNTYYLAYRDLPDILRGQVQGSRALDFGCGTGRSTRFLRQLGFETIGVDIAPEMIAKAKQLDSDGDYRLLEGDDLQRLPRAAYDLVLSVFTFDNVPGFDHKTHLFRTLGGLLNATGKLISVVSSPEIYVNEWASFSTKDYPENQSATSGDVVKIVTIDSPDRRPVDDILCTDDCYRKIYERAGLVPVSRYTPLATGDEPFSWVSETRIAPWVIYVLTSGLALDQGEGGEESRSTWPAPIVSRL
jgi:SAM-dependent methyltransferase